jgi:hypothetical protein
MRRSVGLLVVVAALTLFCASSPAHADWRRDYDRGIKAIEQQQWADAEAAFRSALSEDAAANARKRFQGTRFDVYVPHYYAGLAAYRQGSCERALEYWGNASSTAVVAGISELSSSQRSGVDDCNRRLASTRATPAPTPVAPEKSPALTQTAPPAKTPTTVPREPVAVKPPPPARTPPGNTTPPASAPVKAPATLVTAVGQYLKGDYAAVERLDPATLSVGSSRAQGLLLRAASRHTRALLDGGDASLLEKARRDVRAARAASTALEPDEVVFSPRFRSFWRESR